MGRGERAHMKILPIAAALALGWFSVSAASAEEAEAATAKPDAAAKAARTVECNKQADAKGLHMKDRKKFLSDCKKAM